MNSIQSILDRTFPASKDYEKFLTGYKTSESIKGTYEKDLLKLVEKKLKNIFQKTGKPSRIDVRVNSCFDNQKRLLIPVIRVSFYNRIGEIDFTCFALNEGQVELLISSIEAVLNLSNEAKEMK
jgi:hypothetical protein